MTAVPMAFLLTETGLVGIVSSMKRYGALAGSPIVLLLLALSACGPSLYQDTVEVLPKTRTAHNACIECHPESPEGKLILNPEPELSSACLYCHERENHHPVDFYPDRPTPPNMPLQNGELRCLTCHKIHRLPELDGPPKFLRGGPYKDRREICLRCHNPEKEGKVNPHLMLDGPGKVRELNGRPVCLVCHIAQPDPEKDRTADVRFRADIAFLCWRCHPPMPGEFFTQHFLVNPSRKASRVMRKAEREMGVIFPLVPRNRITCSTCHNPHQDGVIIQKAAAQGADSAHKLRVSSLDMCIACHQTGR